MKSKRLTISDQEFELVPVDGMGVPNYALRPVAKQEEKQMIFLRLGAYDPPSFLYDELDLTSTQAEALASAIQALVEYVQSPITSRTEQGRPGPFPQYIDDNSFIRLADEAREAMQDNE